MEIWKEAADKFTNSESTDQSVGYHRVLGYPVWSVVSLLTISSKQKSGTIMENV